MFSIDRESVPYSWNHTITYDLSKGKMPYLVETLRATAIGAVYHPLEEMLEYSIQASILKGENIQPTERNDANIFPMLQPNVNVMPVCDGRRSQ